MALTAQVGCADGRVVDPATQDGSRLRGVRGVLHDKPMRDQEDIDVPKMIITDDYGEQLPVRSASELRAALVELTGSTRAQLPQRCTS